MSKRLTNVLLGFAAIVGAMAPEGGYMGMPFMEDAADEPNDKEDEPDDTE